jgi:hypothetical protein
MEGFVIMSARWDVVHPGKKNLHVWLDILDEELRRCGVVEFS